MVVQVSPCPILIPSLNKASGLCQYKYLCKQALKPTCVKNNSERKGSLWSSLSLGSLIFSFVFTSGPWVTEQAGIGTKRNALNDSLKFLAKGQWNTKSGGFISFNLMQYEFIAAGTC